MAFWNDLKADVEEWIDRPLTDGAMNIIVKMVSSQINRKLRTSYQLKRAFTIVDSNDKEEFALPSNYLALRHIKYNNTDLEYLTPEQYFNGQTLTGTPRYYTVENNTAYVKPATAVNGELQIAFYEGVEAPTKDDEDYTNNIILLFPDLYLYGTLAEAYGYFLDDEREMKYRALLDQSMNDIQMQNKKDMWTGGSLVQRAE